MFNIAICFEKLNDFENAILYMKQCYELRIKNNSTKASINEASKKIKQFQKTLKLIIMGVYYSFSPNLNYKALLI